MALVPASVKVDFRAIVNANVRRQAANYNTMLATINKLHIDSISEKYTQNSVVVLREDIDGYLEVFKRKYGENLDETILQIKYIQDGEVKQACVNFDYNFGGGITSYSFVFLFRRINNTYYIFWSQHDYTIREKGDWRLVQAYWEDKRHILDDFLYYKTNMKLLNELK